MGAVDHGGQQLVVTAPGTVAGEWARRPAMRPTALFYRLKSRASQPICLAYHHATTAGAQVTSGVFVTLSCGVACQLW
jgi:hypothetical protein